MIVRFPAEQRRVLHSLLCNEPHSKERGRTQIEFVIRVSEYDDTDSIGVMIRRDRRLFPGSVPGSRSIEEHCFIAAYRRKPRGIEFQAHIVAVIRMFVCGYKLHTHIHYYILR